MFAPSHCYGDYDAFKRFVDRAHAYGLAVILDVVYNHLGPDGNYLAHYSPYYFSERHTTEWGQPLNFDGEHNHAVRHFVIANACEWVREFHLDGLRLDATQSIHDDSELHLVAELITRVREVAAPRKVIVVAENEPQHATHLLTSEQGGMGLDAMWNDDFHHSAQVAATGRREAYYLDYAGLAQEFVSAAKHGFLYQGQFYQWQKKHRGQPLATPLSSCVVFLENHDQVANSLYGKHLSQFTSPARYRALVSLLLLMPQTPMLFMGQEFNSATPFLYFADHVAPLKHEVTAGRQQFLSQFASIATDASLARLNKPDAAASFEKCKLDWNELPRQRNWTQLYTDLLRLRREDPVIAAQALNGIDGAVLTQHCFVLRWFDDEQGDRLLLVNLGAEVPVQPSPEPLLASPHRRQWTLHWCSEHPDYGGIGAVNPLTAQGWRLPAESAALFTAVSL
jgi:maltooligosyltrehalose trehalohydrolase